MQESQSSRSHIAVNSQYIKDFSFESPGAPGSLGRQKSDPAIDLSLDLNINKMVEEDLFEVEIIISAKAAYEQKTLFIVDLKYAGVFHLINVPPEETEILLAVHCPSVIFPYARKIIGDVTQNGGFQALMIDPIDFGALYNKKIGLSA